MEIIYDVEKIQDYNRILKETFSSIYYLIYDLEDNEYKNRLLREILYIIESIAKYDPVEDDSKIIIDNNMINFSIIEWDGFYYFNPLDKKYEYYPKVKSYYKMSRSIKDFSLEVTRYNVTTIYTIQNNLLNVEVVNEDDMSLKLKK